MESEKEKSSNLSAHTQRQTYKYEETFAHTRSNSKDNEKKLPLNGCIGISFSFYLCLLLLLLQFFIFGRQLGWQAVSIQVFPSRQVFFFVICCRIHKACVWMGHGVTCKHLYIYICAFCMESLTIHILYMQMGRFDRRARAFCPKIHKNKSRPGNSVPLITHCASTKSWADMTNGLCQKITTNSIIYSYR